MLGEWSMRKGLSALVVSGILVTCLFSSSVDAKVTGHVVEDANKNQFEYNVDALTESFTSFLRNPLNVNAQYYLNYSTKGSLVSFFDNENGYVDFKDISQRYRESLREGNEFDLNKYTESNESVRVEPDSLTNVVVGEDGSIEEIPVEEQKKSFEVLSIN